MKHIILIMAAALSLSSCSTMVKEKALEEEEVNLTFDFGDFNGISAEFSHHITATKGSSNKIEVSCPEKYAEHLDYKISNGILHLKLDLPNSQKKGNNNKIYVNLQMDEVTSISLSGASEMTLSGQYESDSFKLRISGASEFDGEFISAKNMNCSLSGASGCSFSGNFIEATGGISGASKLDLKADATTMKLEASGASKCNYTGNTQKIMVKCSGASNGKFDGTATNADLQCSGASNIDAMGMIAQNASASASGASSIKVTAEKSLDLHTSGCSGIKYYGAASQIQTSGKSISKGQ